MDRKVYSRTTALCPECMEKVDSRIVEIDGKIFLEKLCKVHGTSLALICSDSEWYRKGLEYIKPGKAGEKLSVGKHTSCPESCGLCPEHKQHTCLAVIEITDKCGIACPICLKDWKQGFVMTKSEFRNIIKNLFDCEGNIQIINLSGGEPFEHPEILDFIAIASEFGILQTTISTNGMVFLNHPEILSKLSGKDVLIALQFDGFTSNTYLKLRGADYSKDKIRIIEILEENKINYSLVATIGHGINDCEITDITNFFFNSKAISLMFQPLTLAGKAVTAIDDLNRITIPDIVKNAEKSKFVNKGDFNPLPCSHPSCFALSYYFKVEEGNFLGLKEFLGIDEYLNVISNRTLPGLDGVGFNSIQSKIYDLWSASDTCNCNDAILKRIRSVIDRLNKCNDSPKKAFELGVESMKAIFIHQFMDKYTLDFGRLMKCCNHYPQVDGRLMPMCAQNVFYQKNV